MWMSISQFINIMFCAKWSKIRTLYQTTNADFQILFPSATSWLTYTHYYKTIQGLTSSHFQCEGIWIWIIYLKMVSSHSLPRRFSFRFSTVMYFSSTLIQSFVLRSMELTLILFLQLFLSSLISNHDIFFFTISQGKQIWNLRRMVISPYVKRKIKRNTWVFSS